MPALEQGISSNRYSVIPRVLIFITDQQSRLLMIKGAPSKRIWANRYNGIGGHVERGEDVLSAARRELAEETGLHDISMWLCGSVMIDAGEATGITLFVFRGQYSGGDLIESNEGALEWIPLTELANLPLVEDLPVLVPVVLQQELGMPAFSARYRYDSSDRLVIEFA